MVFLRYLLVVGLSACVCYTGFSVYQSMNFDAANNAGQFESDTFNEEPPLYISPLPSAEVAQSTGEVSNFSPSIPSIPTEVKSVPQNPAITELETASVFTTGTPLMVSETKAKTPEESNTAEDTEVLKTEKLDFAATWKTAEQLEKEFNLPAALEELTRLLIADIELSKEQSAKLIEKLDSLAQKVVFQSNKHLAKPAVTILPNQTLEAIAKENQVPVEFLVTINQLKSADQLTFGDSVKVLPGPLKVKLNTETNQATLFVGKLFAQRFPINSKNLDASFSGDHPLASKSTDTEDESKLLYTLGNDIVLSAEESDSKDPQLVLSEGSLKRLSSLIGSEVEADLFVKAAPEPVLSEVETKLTSAEEEIPKQEPVPPIDSLKMEVFSPIKPAVVGQEVLYGLRISNLSDKPVSDVSVVSFFSEGLEPKAIEGAKGKISLGQASFQLLSLKAGEKIELTIKAVTQQAGQLVFRPEVESKAFDSKLVSEVYLKVKGSAPVPETANSSENATR